MRGNYIDEFGLRPRIQFLTGRFRSMLSAADNDLLTRTGPGTPMGEYFRRYWLPVAVVARLPEPDGRPCGSMLGEDLLAFRDTRAASACIEQSCAHRRAIPFYGRNEESGIRCIYHGWKYDVEGRCIECPTCRPGPRTTARSPSRPIRRARPASSFGLISVRATPHAAELP